MCIINEITSQCEAKPITNIWEWKKWEIYYLLIVWFFQNKQHFAIQYVKTVKNRTVEKCFVDGLALCDSLFPNLEASTVINYYKLIINEQLIFRKWVFFIKALYKLVETITHTGTLIKSRARKGFKMGPRKIFDVFFITYKTLCQNTLVYFIFYFLLTAQQK